MSSDRELLELAAKAEGRDLSGWSYLDETGQFYWSGAPSREGTQAFQVWNPLGDDGDALRLAVELGLSIIVEPFFIRIHSFKDVPLVREEVVLDGFAATRRAIVRAAYEIGRSTNAS